MEDVLDPKTELLQYLMRRRTMDVPQHTASAAPEQLGLIQGISKIPDAFAYGSKGKEEILQPYLAGIEQRRKEQAGLDANSNATSMKLGESDEARRMKLLDYLGRSEQAKATLAGADQRAKDQRTFVAGENQKNRDQRSELAAKKTAGIGGPSALKAADKKRYDDIQMALKGIGDMEAGLQAGDWTRRPFGDNTFTMGLSRYGEGLGRMQSGGAITNDEWSKFQKFAPGPTDTADVQQTKLRNAREEMENRLRTLGFEPGAAAPQQKADDAGSDDPIRGMTTEELMRLTGGEE